MLHKNSKKKELDAAAFQHAAIEASIFFGPFFGILGVCSNYHARALPTIVLSIAGSIIAWCLFQARYVLVRSGVAPLRLLRRRLRKIVRLGYSTAVPFFRVTLIYGCMASVSAAAFFGSASPLSVRDKFFIPLGAYKSLLPKLDKPICEICALTDSWFTRPLSAEEIAQILEPENPPVKIFTAIVKDRHARSNRNMHNFDGPAPSKLMSDHSLEEHPPIGFLQR